MSTDELILIYNVTYDFHNAPGRSSNGYFTGDGAHTTSIHLGSGEQDLCLSHGERPIICRSHIIFIVVNKDALHLTNVRPSS